MYKVIRATLLITLTLLVSPLVSAKGVFQSGPDFIAGAFNQPPSKATLWLTNDIRLEAAKILGHQLAGLRIRYHRLDNKTAWILEEIGKEMPITIGVVISEGKIEQVKILAYRESRGGEVRYPAYTRQYFGASLTDKNKLDQPIDGITGATLSVWAVNKVAALALYYHGQVINPRDPS